MYNSIIQNEKVYNIENKYALSLLKGISFDDMDNTYGEEKPCQSLTHGEVPVLSNYTNINEETNAIIEEIKRLLANGKQG